MKLPILESCWEQKIFVRATKKFTHISKKVFMDGHSKQCVWFAQKISKVLDFSLVITQPTISER